MKITIDKELTLLSQVEQVKKDMQDFKHGWEDNDLLCAFFDATEIHRPWNVEIVSVTGEAFPGGSYYNDETQFHFEIIAKGWKEFYVIRFYCDCGLKINTGDLMDYRGFSTGQKMYDFARYVLAKD